MKKKLKIFLLGMILVIVLSSCVSTSTNNDDQRKKTETSTDTIITKELGNEFDEKTIGDSDYYEDIYRAVENNRFREPDGNGIELIDLLKTIENDDKAIVYGVISYPKGYESFTVLSFLKKEEEGKTLYSIPLINLTASYDMYEDEYLDLEVTGKAFFQSLNYWHRDKITIEEKKNFQYFLLRTREKAEKIRINGQKPDGIIEHQVSDIYLDKHKSYLVYFNDIEMSGGYDNMEISFD